MTALAQAHEPKDGLAPDAAAGAGDKRDAPLQLSCTRSGHVGDGKVSTEKPRYLLDRRIDHFRVIVER